MSILWHSHITLINLHFNTMPWTTQYTRCALLILRLIMTSQAFIFPYFSTWSTHSQCLGDNHLQVTSSLTIQTKLQWLQSESGIHLHDGSPLLLQLGMLTRVTFRWTGALSCLYMPFQLTVCTMKAHGGPGTLHSFRLLCGKYMQLVYIWSSDLMWLFTIC